MNPAIGREFHFASLLKFAFPSIIMMIFMSLYTIVDGIFISRFVGTAALSATNIVYPVINVTYAFSIMLATGGSAIVARKLGEGKPEEARRDFSLITLATVLIGVLIALAGCLFIDPLCRMLDADQALIGYCRDYLRILLLFAPASMLQLLFQIFFVTAGRPGLGLGLTIAAGLSNAILDYVLIVPCGFGIAGAALATAAGYLIPAIIGLFFFCRPSQTLHFGRPKFSWAVLAESCFNGSSEMVTNLSNAIITFLFNILMLHYIGEDGVAAVTIVLYAQFLLTALYLGFSLGVAPVISFNHGSENSTQLKRLYRICISFIAGSSLVIFLLSLLLSRGIVRIFTPDGSPVFPIALEGFWLFSLSFLFSGINIFASGMFTALSNGRISAVISFLRTFGFILLGLLFLPKMLAVTGIWLAVPFAELATLLFSVIFMWKMRSNYHYA